MSRMRYTFTHTGDRYALQISCLQDSSVLFMELLATMHGNELLEKLLTAYAQENSYWTTTGLFAVVLTEDFITISSPAWCWWSDEQITCSLDALVCFTLWDSWQRVTAHTPRIVVLEWDGDMAFHFEVFDEIYL